MVVERHVPVRPAGFADQQQPRLGHEAEEIRESAGGRGIPGAISHRASSLSRTVRQVGWSFSVSG